MGKSNYFENEVLRLRLGKPLQGTYPSTVYLALFTTMPGEDGTGGVEVSGQGYARFANIGSKFPDPSGAGTVTNNSDIAFGTAGSSWGNVKGVGTYTSATGGQLTGSTTLAQPFDIASGQPVVIPSGAATFEEQ
jgi:hypothetical protein